MPRTNTSPTEQTTAGTCGARRSDQRRPVRLSYQLLHQTGHDHSGQEYASRRTGDPPTRKHDHRTREKDGSQHLSFDLRPDHSLRLSGGARERIEQPEHPAPHRIWNGSTDGIQRDPKSTSISSGASMMSAVKIGYPTTVTASTTFRYARRNRSCSSWISAKILKDAAGPAT